jgi:hypothetical protein
VTDICPVCGETMVVTRLSCAHCASALEGTFRVVAPGGAGAPGSRSGPLGARRTGDDSRFGPLARLDQAQLEFVETFVRCRGVIKNVEDMLGISYPTVKARLANVLETMGFGINEEPAAERRRMRRTILADLAAGRISTEEAHQLLLGNPRAGGDDDDDDDGDDDGDNDGDGDGQDTADEHEGKARP